MVAILTATLNTARRNSERDGPDNNCSLSQRIPNSLNR
jgi:hypothetical protein